MQMTDGNGMFWVCVPCLKNNEKEHGIMAAGRTRAGYYECAAPDNQIDAWFGKHSKCGGRANPDHFKLALSYEANHDQQKLKAVQ